MDKIGRNDPCPCGSGKKFKKCCGDSKHLSNENILQMNVPTIIATIPDTIAMLAIDQFSAHRYEVRINEMLTNAGLRRALGWPDTKIKTFSEQLLMVATHEALPFDLSIRSNDCYRTLIETNSQIALRIYWNEIDQRVHWYRCNVITELSRRIRSAIDSFGNILVLSLLARHILEVVLDSISNQWAITTAHNILRKQLPKEEYKTAVFVSCKDLEDFVIALIVWPTRRLKMMEEFLGKEKIDWEALKYNPPESSPTTEQQLNVAKHMAKSFDEIPQFEKQKLPTSIEQISKAYKYLSGFVHPTPQMFTFEHQHLPYSDRDVLLSVEVATINVIEQCVKIFNLLFSSEMFNVRFEPLTSKVGSLSHGNVKVPRRDILLTFIKDFMKRYKELIVKTTKGDIPIWKKPGSEFSKETAKITKTYESLNQKQKVAVREFIDSIKADVQSK